MRWYHSDPVGLCYTPDLRTVAHVPRYLEELETFIKAPKFKHKDFWNGE
jgi:hypothetical protein